MFKNRQESQIVPSQASEIDKLSWSLVSGYLHLQSISRVTHILGSEDCTLLTNKKRSLGIALV
jgi:hypothetical protein